MKQIYSNNAKTTLASAISASAIVLQLTDASTFPTPAADEYYLVTLELAGQIEICRVTGKTGNNLSLASTGDRGQESTTPAAFPAGTKVEMRITKGSLDILSKALLPLSSVDLLVSPLASINTGYIVETYDPFGAPIVVVRKDDSVWRFLNFTAVQTGIVVVTSTTNQVTAAAISITNLAAGEHLIQFTSGALAGQVRVVSSNTGTAVNWATATGSAPLAGVTFDLYRANSSLLSDAALVADDAIVMPIILGG